MTDKTISALVELETVTHIIGNTVKATFSDGIARTVDLNEISCSPLWDEVVKDSAVAGFTVSGVAITWSNGYTIPSEDLRLNVTV